MKKYRLQKIGIKSLAKIYLVLGFMFSLVFGLFMFIPMLGEQGWPSSLFVLLPLVIFYPLFAVIFASILVWLYNLIASKVGGVEVYLKEDILVAPAPIEKDSNNKIT